jgi:hypothetical protein
LFVYPAKVLLALHSTTTEGHECIQVQNAEAMKQKLALFTVAILILSACATPKAYYETKEGKRKQKYYNDIQYGRNAHPKMKF